MQTQVPYPVTKFVPKPVHRPYEVVVPEHVPVPYPVEQIVERRVPYPVEHVCICLSVRLVACLCHENEISS